MRTTTRFQLPWLAAGILALATACMTAAEERIAPTEVALTASSAAAVGGTQKTLEIRGRLFPKKDGKCELDLRVSNIDPNVDYEIRIIDGDGPVVVGFEPPLNTQSAFSISALGKPEPYWALYLGSLGLWDADEKLIKAITPDMINNRCFTPTPVGD